MPIVFAPAAFRYGRERRHQRRRLLRFSRALLMSATICCCSEMATLTPRVAVEALFSCRDCWLPPHYVILFVDADMLSTSAVTFMLMLLPPLRHTLLICFLPICRAPLFDTDAPIIYFRRRSLIFARRRVMKMVVAASLRLV